MSKIFTQIFAWKRLDASRAVRFSCLEDISTRQFIVQSADFFSLPIKPSLVSYLDRNWVALFIELDPENRPNWSSSLDEAIAVHETQFGIHSAPLSDNDNLDEQETTITELIKGKVVSNVRMHRPSEIMIEFDDGTRIFINGLKSNLDVSITG